MAPVRNGALLYKAIPEGYPVPGETTVYDNTQTIDPDSVPLNGGFLMKTLALSIDPFIRGRMRDPSLPGPPCFAIGSPLDNYGIGVVLRSEHPDIKKGDHVYGILPFQEYILRSDTQYLNVIENKENIPWRHYVGAAGMAGQSAYFGWKTFSKSKKGETAFVSSAAGQVGSIIVQLAKRDGLKVIASAGSDDKVKSLKELGVDVAFNYKTTDTKQVLKDHGPIDIYWDNVGGETLEAALDASNKNARFIECGMLSTYNSKTPYGVKNLFNIIIKAISMNGFVITDFYTPEGLADFYANVPAMIASGELKVLEDIREGLETAGEALVDLLKGNTRGKIVITLAQS